jgi:isopentenyl-diphosphate delta-isomerase type 1
MVENYFDVVDFKDEVLGQALRERVHAEQLRHRAVHILLRDERGRVLLQRRSVRKENYPGCWDSACSGHVDAGESYLTAAERELREELGMEVRGLRALFKIDAREETGWEFVWVYEGRISADALFKLNADEVDEVSFFELDEIEGELVKNPNGFARAFRYLWPFYRLRLEPLSALGCEAWV